MSSDPPKIPVYVIDRETLKLLEETSPIHAAVARLCLADGRWILVDIKKVTP